MPAYVTCTNACHCNLNPKKDSGKPEIRVCSLAMHDSDRDNAGLAALPFLLLQQGHPSAALLASAYPLLHSKTPQPHHHQ